MLERSRNTEGTNAICVDVTTFIPQDVDKCSGPQDCKPRELVCVRWPGNGPNLGLCTVALFYRYCSDNDGCDDGLKCVASGRPQFGICVEKSDPTGKYCRRTKDCRWYALEKCSDQGECVNRYK